MSRYEIRVDDTVVRNSRRVDHARRYYEEAETEPGQTKRLVDTQIGDVLEEHTAGQAKAPAPKGTKPTRDKGDPVAVYLRNLSIEETAVLAEALLERLISLGKSPKAKPIITPARERKDRDAIQRALHRAAGTGEYAGKANPGSARMSLGNILRKYIRRLEPITQESPQQILDNGRSGS